MHATKSNKTVKLVEWVDYIIDGGTITIINKAFLPIETEHGVYENIWDLKIQYESTPCLNRQQRRIKGGYKPLVQNNISNIELKIQSVCNEIYG